MRRIVLAALLITVLALPAFAQKTSIGLTGGSTSIQSPSYFTDAISDVGYGFGTAFCYGIKAKIAPENVPLTLAWQVSFAKFSGEDENVKLEQSLTIYGVGVEWHYFQLPGSITPYLSTDVFISNFGNLKGNYYGENVDITATLKLGAGLGAGFTLPVFSSFNFDASVKYNFNSLSGLSADEDGFNTLNISASVLYSFN